MTQAEEDRALIARLRSWAQEMDNRAERSRGQRWPTFELNHYEVGQIARALERAASEVERRVEPRPAWDPPPIPPPDDDRVERDRLRSTCLHAAGTLRNVVIANEKTNAVLMGALGALAIELEREAGRPGSGQPAAEKPAPVWYGMCRHWTDDWSKLRPGGVPLCPLDGAPGFHAAKTWWADVDRYEADGHPGYRAEVEALELP